MVGTAHTADEARRLTAELSPDLVLLDMDLPDGPGTELLGELSADVMMVTAASDAASVRKALGRGAVNYLVKPFTRANLADRLRACAKYRGHVAGTARWTRSRSTGQPGAAP